MRLFVAICFDDETKRKLQSATEKLKSLAEKGNFTRTENLHLTLAFLGETQKRKQAEKAMDSIVAFPFEMKISGLGRFGDIYWARAIKTEELLRVHTRLVQSLAKEGFDIPQGEYTPHVTLGRGVKIRQPFDFDIPEMTVYVDRIVLMKSERINGRLVYTGIYEKKFC
ncbi:MAG: 2',5' RNA ligase family [Firmicutes bacterium ADurb.Bin193]|nr:MAG: 2',5' RNA ligase family [Firmicutes bacterium ADurb.Bin193]